MVESFECLIMKHLLLFSLAISLPAALIALYACDSSEREGAGLDEVSPPAPTAMTVLEPAATALKTPANFTNLRVLPDDIGKDELLQRMKLITQSLGVKCDFCHRTDTRNYASDEIKKKVVARQMMSMVGRINREHFTWEGAPKATCFLCHHGQSKPRLEP